MRIISLAVAMALGSAVGVAHAENITQSHTEEANRVAASSAITAKKAPEADEALSELAPVAPELIEQLPVLKHIAKSGAQVLDLGSAHGLRAVVARQAGQFMILQVAPDGEAVVAGAQTELSARKMLAIAGSGQQATELGMAHGMRGLFVRDGEQFQVFYAAPDQETLIPGVMWDATGKNITKEQTASLPGVTPTVTIGKDMSGEKAAIKSALEVAEKTSFAVVGQASAPRVFVFIDPLCIYSIRALQQLQPFVASGLVQAAFIPLSVLDYEDDGRSTTSALAMLSKPADQMVEAWSRGDLKGRPGSDAETKLRANMAAAEGIGLRGTPTLVWRKADGSEGRVDGLPENWNAIIGSMGGEHHAAR